MQEKFGVAVRHAGISLDAIERADIGLLFHKLNMQEAIISEITLEAKRDRSYEDAHSKMREPVVEYGNILIDLKKHYYEYLKSLSP